MAVKNWVVRHPQPVQLMPPFLGWPSDSWQEKIDNKATRIHEGEVMHESHEKYLSVLTDSHCSRRGDPRQC